MSVRVRFAACIALTIGACVAATTTTAAQVDGAPPQIQAAGADTIMTSGGAQRAGGPGPVYLDRPIDRTEYELGPSDALILSIFGFRSQVYDLTVTPEGTVVIPTVGVVPVGGVTIAEAEREVARHVRRYYQDADIRLSLSDVRRFNTYVVGDTPSPGLRQATPVTRVSELVAPMDADGIVRRNIVVRRTSGAVLHVDLARFLRLGDLDQNPTVREGDVIHVPATHQTVTITGPVAFPGIYEFRQGESLAELLVLANGGGPFPADAADSLRIVRFTRDPRGEILPIARYDGAVGEGGGLMVEPFDAIFIPRVAHFARPYAVTIGGEVARPGSYPIEPGVTTVRDLVEMAGGFTPQASLVDATLRREPVVRAGETVPLDAIPPELLTEEDRRILAVTRRADEQNVVLDFGTMFAEPQQAYDLPLENGDRLYVPELRNEVTVLGAVGEPGIVEFQPGQSIEHYVELAGSYTRRADRDKVVVLKARAGTQIDRGDDPMIERGDRIVVPFRRDRTFLETLQLTQGVVNTVSGLVLTIIGLERLFDVF